MTKLLFKGSFNKKIIFLVLFISLTIHNNLFSQGRESGGFPNVNLSNGAFSYGMPIMTVPGDGVSYPISLSYFAGIGLNQDAGMIGLGWSINIGNISRDIEGYPDDYCGEVYNYNYNSNNPVFNRFSNTLISVNNGLLNTRMGIFGNGNNFLSASNYYKNYAELKNTKLLTDETNSHSMPFGSLYLGYYNKYPFNQNITAVTYQNVTTTNFCRSMDMFKNRVELFMDNVTGGSYYPWFYYSGIAYDKYFVNVAGIQGRIRPIVLESGSLVGNSNPANFDKYYQLIPFSAPEGEIDGGKLSDIQFIYQLDPANKLVEKPMPVTMTSTYNGYITTENFKHNIDPLATKGFDFNTNKIRNKRIVEWFTLQQLKNLEKSKIPLNANIIDNPFDFYKITGILSNNLLYAPELNKTRIYAYKITDENGYVYHFGLPVLTYNQKSITYPIKPNGTIDVSDAASKVISENRADYAVKWMLTAITSPDYIDINNNGITDNEDKGGWIKFEYAKGDDLHKRFPLEKDKYTRDATLYNYTYSEGKLQNYFLKAIKSNTHTLFPIYDIRQDYCETYDGTTKYNEYHIKKMILLKNDNELVAQENTLISQGNINNLLDNTTYENNKNFFKSKLVDAVEFESNYELCKGHPMSNDNNIGKLTLKSLNFFNAQTESLFPKIRFNYYAENALNNPNYKFDYYNTWGLYFDNFRPDYPVRRCANMKGSDAWCLREIETPIGSKTQINYGIVMPYGKLLTRDVNTINGNDISSIKYQYYYPSYSSLPCVYDTLSTGVSSDVASNPDGNGPDIAFKEVIVSSYNNNLFTDSTVYTLYAYNSNELYGGISRLAFYSTTQLQIRDNNNVKIFPRTVEGTFTLSALTTNTESFIGQPIKIDKYNKVGHLVSSSNYYYYSNGLYPGTIKEHSHSICKLWGSDVRCTYEYVGGFVCNPYEQPGANLNIDWAFEKCKQNYYYEHCNINELSDLKDYGTDYLTFNTNIIYPCILSKVVTNTPQGTTTVVYKDLDEITGEPKTTEVYKSYAEIIKTITTPAYEKYPELGSKFHNPNNKNILLPKVSSTTYLYNPDKQEYDAVISASVSTWNNNWLYKYWDVNTNAFKFSNTNSPYTNNLAPHKQYIWKGNLDNNGAYENFLTANNGNGKFFNWDLTNPDLNSANGWLCTSENTTMSTDNSIIENKTIGNIYSASYSNPAHKNTFVSVSNSNLNSSTFASFEEVDNVSNYYVFENGIFSSVGAVARVIGNYDIPSHSGLYYLSVNPSTEACAYKTYVQKEIRNQNGVITQAEGLLTNRKYKAQVWVYNNCEIANVKIKAELNYANGGKKVVESNDEIEKPLKMGDWILKTLYIDITDKNTDGSLLTNIKVSVVNENTDKVLIDDFKFGPFDAALSATILNPLTKETISVVDNDNLTTDYIYYDNKKLKEVKVDTKNGKVKVKEYKYHYKRGYQSNNDINNNTNTTITNPSN